MSRIFCKINSWGLGHATRNLPIIRRLVQDGHRVTVASTGRALRLVQLELRDRCQYLRMPDYRSDWGRDYHWVFLMPKAPVELPRFFRGIVVEKKLVHEVVRSQKYDLLISDSCYGASHPDVPSYFICHALKLPWFWQGHYSQRLNEWLASLWVNRYNQILVPDYKGSPLSGKLSGDLKFIDERKVRYVGILSDFRRQNCDEDIDYLIPISGAEPQRSSFEARVLRQVLDLEGTIVIALGKPDAEGQVCRLGEAITVIDFLRSPGRDELMNRAKMVICRSGYSTLMDLVQLRKKKVLFVPTPNHTEQEYLATYHRECGNIYSVPQKRMNLAEDVIAAAQYPGLPPLAWSTDQSVDLVMDVIFSRGR